MTLQEFIDKYDGKKIDYDGYYGTQCMDVYRQYVKEVLNIPQSPPVSGAKDVWDTYLPEYYERIPNTSTGVPRAGDIMIWGEEVGPFGHIAIFMSGTERGFTSFDQNWPNTGGTGVAHVQGHDYTGVLGWLHPKQNMEVPMPSLPYNEHAAKLIREDDALRHFINLVIIRTLEGARQGILGEIDSVGRQNDTNVIMESIQRGEDHVMRDIVLFYTQSPQAVAQREQAYDEIRKAEQARMEALFALEREKTKAMQDTVVSDLKSQLGAKDREIQALQNGILNMTPWQKIKSGFADLLRQFIREEEK